MTLVSHCSLLQSSKYVHSTTRFILAAGSERPKTKQVNLGLVLLLCAALSLTLAACTEGAGLGDTSSGWSPVAAIAIPLDTGSRINEGRNVDPLDNTLTVTDVTIFDVGQVIQIDEERLRITSIREQDLVVIRGENNTVPKTHANESIIYTIGDRFVVFVSTKQGEIQALNDDGLGGPLVQWRCGQGQCQR